jgi:hypothetical protein
MASTAAAAVGGGLKGNRTMSRDPAITREEMVLIVGRFGINDADPEFIARALVLSNATLANLTRLPDLLDSNIEPAPRFSVPLR